MNDAPEQSPWRRAAPYLAGYGLAVVLLALVFGDGIYNRWLIGCVESPGAPFCGMILRSAGIDAAPDGASPFAAGAIGAGRFPQSSLRVMNEGDFAGLTCADLRILRNEIYARHGHIFVSPEMRDHFTAQPWYRPQVPDATALLSAVEKENIALTFKQESTLQCR